MAAPNKISVLIVEKEQDTRDLIREIILSITKQVLIIEANDGIKAEFKLANQQFHIVIAALKLAGKDGVQLIKTFNKMEPKKKPKALVLLLDGEFNEKWRELFKPIYYIKKPCEADALRVVITSAFTQKPETSLNKASPEPT